MADDTYEAPEHGWVCFHCGECFPGTMDGQRRARDHFGMDPSADPACRIKRGHERNLVRKLRGLERQIARYQEEDTDLHRQVYTMEADHAVALRRAEEDGYAKGLRDGRLVTAEDGNH